MASINLFDSDDDLNDLEVEAKEKVEIILSGLDEYVEKILGKNFPGTGTRPAETNMPQSWETAQMSDTSEKNIP